MHSMKTPSTTRDPVSGGEQTVAEVNMYPQHGEVALRFVSGTYEGHYMPKYQLIPADEAAAVPLNFGLQVNAIYALAVTTHLHIGGLTQRYFSFILAR